MSSSSFALKHLSLFPDTLAEKRILCFETKQQSDGTEAKTSAHLEFSDTGAMIAFYESTATKIYKQTTRYDDMKNEQARLYKEHLEQMMKEELSGGEGDAATKMQNAIHASEHKEIVAQEETRKLAIAPYGNEDGALALLSNESDDGMDVQQKLRLAKMVRDIMHTVLCGIVLPTLEGNTGDATGAALGLLQGLMGTEIVGHMLRFATSVYVTVGSLNDTILGHISSAMRSMFGAESWIASSCTMFFQYLSSLTGQIATVGALITAGTAFLYQWLPEAAQEYIREWVIKPIQSWMEPVLQWFQGKSVRQIQISDLTQAFRTGGYVSTIISFLLHPSQSLFLPATYAAIGIINVICSNSKEGSMCAYVKEETNRFGFFLTVVSIATSLVHSIEMLLFQTRTRTVFDYTQPYAPRLTEYARDAYQSVVHSPVANALSLPCAARMERVVFSLDPEEKRDQEFVRVKYGARAVTAMSRYAHDRNKMSMDDVVEFERNMRALHDIPEDLERDWERFHKKLMQSKSIEERRRIVGHIDSFVSRQRQELRSTVEVKTGGDDATLKVTPIGSERPQTWTEWVTPSLFTSQRQPALVDRLNTSRFRRNMQSQLKRELRGLGLASLERSHNNADYDAKRLEATLDDLVTGDNRGQWEASCPDEQRQARIEWLQTNMPRGRNMAKRRDAWSEVINTLRGTDAPQATIVYRNTDDENMIQRFGRTFGYRTQKDASSSSWSFFSSEDTSTSEIIVVIGEDTIMTNVQQDYLHKYVERLRAHETADYLVFDAGKNDGTISEHIYLLKNNGGVTWDPSQPLSQIVGQAFMNGLMVKGQRDMDLTIINPSERASYVHHQSAVEQDDVDRLSRCFCVHLDAKHAYVKAEQRKYVRRAGDDTPPTGYMAFSPRGLRRIWDQMSWYWSSSTEEVLPDPMDYDRGSLFYDSWPRRLAREAAAQSADPIAFISASVKSQFKIIADENLKPVRDEALDEFVKLKLEESMYNEHNMDGTKEMQELPEITLPEDSVDAVARWGRAQTFVDLNNQFAEALKLKSVKDMASKAREVLRNEKISSYQKFLFGLTMNRIDYAQQQGWDDERKRHYIIFGSDMRQ